MFRVQGYCCCLGDFGLIASASVRLSILVCKIGAVALAS